MIRSLRYNRTCDSALVSIALTINTLFHNIYGKCLKNTIANLFKYLQFSSCNKHILFRKSSQSTHLNAVGSHNIVWYFGFLLLDSFSLFGSESTRSCNLHLYHKLTACTLALKYSC